MAMAFINVLAMGQKMRVYLRMVKSVDMASLGEWMELILKGIAKMIIQTE